MLSEVGPAWRLCVRPAGAPAALDWALPGVPPLVTSSWIMVLLGMGEPEAARVGVPGSLCTLPSCPTIMGRICCALESVGLRRSKEGILGMWPSAADVEGPCEGSAAADAPTYSENEGCAACPLRFGGACSWEEALLARDLLGAVLRCPTDTMSTCRRELNFDMGPQCMHRNANENPATPNEKHSIKP